MGRRGLMAMVLDGAALDASLHGEATDPRAYLARYGYDAPPLDHVAEHAPPIEAEVNHGIWVWLCPCKLGGELDPPVGGGVVWVSLPFGWCPRCQNAATGGAWRPLRVPTEREAIEAALLPRTDPTTRNWWPGETVDELVAQNALYGIEGG
jgi:hypothetical protein